MLCCDWVWSRHESGGQCVELSRLECTLDTDHLGFGGSVSCLIVCVSCKVLPFLDRQLEFQKSVVFEAKLSRLCAFAVSWLGDSQVP